MFKNCPYPYRQNCQNPIGIRAADMESALESHLSKFVSLVPSLALLIHLADHPPRGPVGEEAFVTACAWALCESAS